MGFNSVLVILNDRLDEIRKDPQFGEKVYQAIISHNSRHREGYRQPYVTGQTEVISVQHADTMQIVAVGGNTGRVLGYGSCRDDDDRLIKNLNQDRLRKKREEKKNVS